MPENDDAPQPPDELHIVNELENYARTIAGDAAEFLREEFNDGWILGLSVIPMNTRARRITVTGEQFLIVAIGTEGGRWELDYDDEDVIFAKGLIEAAIAGRVSERFGFGRSKVTVVLADGTRHHETGYGSCLAVLVPQPGWTIWGRRVDYEPYVTPSVD